MQNEVKYFKGPVGHVVSDGKTKVNFPISIIAVTRRDQMKLLEKSKHVTEVSMEEAVSTYPHLYKKPEEGEANSEGSSEETNLEEDTSEESESVAEPTKKELVETAKKLGISEEEIKKAKTKADLVALIQDAREEEEEDEE